MNRALQDQDTFDVFGSCLTNANSFRIRRQAPRSTRWNEAQDWRQSLLGWLRGSAGWFTAPAAVLAVIASQV
jgi:hypothetical protein